MRRVMLDAISQNMMVKGDELLRKAVSATRLCSASDNVTSVNFFLSPA